MKRLRLVSLLLSLALLLTLAACRSDGGPSGSQSGSSSGASSDSPSGTSSSANPAGSASSSGDGSAAGSQTSFLVPFQLAIYPSYSVHPALAGNRANLTLAPLLYEPLFQLNGSFQAEPVLCAEKTVSEDRLTWTFTLKEGITFSDGTPLTAQVVADALNTARGAGSRFAARLAGIASVSASPEGAVVITLNKPNGNLPVLLDVPIALGPGDRPAGTGPYVLVENGEDLLLSARGDWWQAGSRQMPLQELPLAQVEGTDGLISAFDAGEVGLVDVDLMGTNAIGYSGGYETWDYATTDFVFLGFNTRSGVCRSDTVRRALARGIDVENIAQGDFARHAVPATLPVHPYCPLYNQTLAQAAPYSPEDMTAGLTEAGVLGRTLHFVVNSENTAKTAAAQRIAYQLEAAGMEVNLERLSFESFTNALSNGNFDLYLGEVVLTADFDLAPLLSSKGNLNWMRWSDKDTDDLLSTLAAAGDDTRSQAADALFTHLNEQVPLVPVCFKNGSVLTQWGRLTGVAPVRENAFHSMENWHIR